MFMLYVNYKHMLITISDKWNGTNSDNGKDCPDGVYFYTFNGAFINKEPFQD